MELGVRALVSLAVCVVLGEPVPVELGEPVPVELGEPVPVELGEPVPVELGETVPVELGEPVPVELAVKLVEPVTAELDEPVGILVVVWESVPVELGELLLEEGGATATCQTGIVGWLHWPYATEDTSEAAIVVEKIGAMLTSSSSTRSPKSRAVQQSVRSVTTMRLTRVGSEKRTRNQGWVSPYAVWPKSNSHEPMGAS